MYIWVYLLIVNFIGFISMWRDKRKAERNRWRIRESTLWLIAFFGGAFMMMVAMHLLRHKSRHLTFRIGLPILTVIHIVMTFFLL
ncbi:DUF1294 domain-containing protein [Bacillus kexueae]|uniref:DUF1294 domain-containing protein n=1 Tax=Aeribacillus kexueae TaxID=2078952 RepID=UPI001FAFF6A1|nr:DUF1294 domain-containing protein [Bacillus kexueae]